MQLIIYKPLDVIRMALALMGSFSVNFSAYSNDLPSEVGYLEKLRAQQEREHLALENDIITMSDAEYKSMLAKRMDGAFSDNNATLEMVVIVDVSEEINEEPSFFSKLTGSKLETKEIGLSSIETMLTKKGLDKPSKLSFKRQMSSDDGTKHFQRLEGRFTKSASKLLISDPSVTDVSIVDARTRITRVETFYVPKGRFVPAPANKIYDDNQIDEGLYQDVMTRLDASESTNITIGFHQDPDYYDPPTSEKERERFLEVDEFLVSMEGFNITVQSKRAFGVDAVVDREAAKALFEDPRVDYIRLNNKRGKELFR